MANQDIAFDIGGMRFRSGLVDEEGHVTQQVTFESPSRPEEVVEHIKRIVESYSVTADNPLVGIAIGGMVEKGGLVTAGSMNMNDYPLADMLDLKRPVAILNDAKAAALAEGTYNPRLTGKHSFILMTVSAGIGGGIMINGDLYEGHMGTAGEVGHMIIDHTANSYCRLGHRGCLDSLASGRALKNRLSKLWREGHWTQHADSMRLSYLPELLANGDGMAHRLVQETGMWIGAGIMNIVRVLDPCEIVFKGYLATTLWDYLHPNIAAALASYERYIPMSLASLGTEVGLVGAALAARRAAAGIVEPSCTKE
ncbi:MAG: ROK family protein [bacterium]